MHPFPNFINSKLPQVGTTIFTVMSALANEHKAINLSQGFPDFEIDDELASLVNHYLRRGYNQYAPMPGILPLRERIAEKAFDLYGASYSPESEVTVVSGATQAIYTAITAMIRKEDEVIIFEPAYDSYVPAIQLAGGIPVYMELKAPAYTIDWEEVKKVVNHKTKMIIINSPQNPTGSYLNANDMKELESITSGTEITIISDEVYEHILFDGLKHESVMKYPKLAERSFAVYSFGKTYHATGWKMGYCLAPANLMIEFRKVHQFVVFSSTTFIQYALADYMKNKNYLGLGEFYQAKRDFFLKQIKGSKFTYIPARGSYFQCLNYSAISQEKDLDFAIRMTKEAGVASVPVSAFYKDGTDNKILRFCFAKKEETLLKAAEKILAAEKMLTK